MSKDTSVSHQIALETTANKNHHGRPLEWDAFDHSVAFVKDTIDRLAADL